jgi:hypothetical protein
VVEVEARELNMLLRSSSLTLLVAKSPYKALIMLDLPLRCFLLEAKEGEEEIGPL